jgi:FtsH-binding integral membrane protein
VKLKSAIWTREAGTNIDSLDQRTYVGMISFWTTFGLILTAFGSSISYSWEPTLTLILIVFGVSIIGIFLNRRDRHPITNVIGLSLVAFPFGLMLGPVFAVYTAASVVQVLALTILMTVSLGLLGIMIPKSLEHWSSYLFGALIVLILGMFAVPLLSMAGLPVAGFMTLIDWAAVVLFSLLIIYDMNRAMRLPRTHSSAIEVSLAIYLDVINLMLHLLRIFGVKAGDD